MPISFEEARALYDGGAPVARVASELGMDAREFLRHRKTHGWPLRPSPVRKSATPGLKPSSRPAAKPKTARAKKTRRKPPVRKPAAQAIEAPDIAAGAPVANFAHTRRKLERALHESLSSVEKKLSSGANSDVERNARILASLVKSLAELRRLEALEPRSDDNTGAADGTEDERPPRDIETLRDELSRALERMSVEPAGPQAGG